MCDKPMNIEQCSPPLCQVLMLSSIRLGLGILLLGVTLFVSYGSLVWPMAWCYLVLVLTGMAVTSILVARVHPDLSESTPEVGSSRNIAVHYSAR